MNVIKKIKKNFFLQEQNILQEILISANFTFKKKQKNKKKQPQSPDQHYNNKKTTSVT